MEVGFAQNLFFHDFDLINLINPHTSLVLQGGIWKMGTTVKNCTF